MLPASANVIGNQVIVGDLIALLGMVPAPSRVLDELSVVVDQHVVDDNPPRSE